jgi:hypothetical protein
LGAELDVDRKGLVITVPGNAIQQGRTSSSTSYIAHHKSVVTIAACALGVVFETIEHIRGVEIVHPMEIALLPVLVRRLALGFRSLRAS